MKIALNTSTLAPFNLPLDEQIKIAALAGFKGIELWVKDIQEYLKNGHTPDEILSLSNDKDIKIVNGIAFAKWCDSDEEIRKEAFLQAEEEIALLASIGCQAIAAPPYGDLSNITHDEMARGYQHLCNIAKRYDLKVYLELWGMSPMLSRISQAMYVLVESEITEGKLLLDSYHLYKGGNNFDTIKFLDEKHIGIFHINDYPAVPSRELINDSDRVFPGDGVAPLSQLIYDLNRIGYCGYISLELFIKNFGSKTPLQVAQEGYSKIEALLNKKPKFTSK